MHGMRPNQSYHPQQQGGYNFSQNSGNVNLSNYVSNQQRPVKRTRYDAPQGNMYHNQMQQVGGSDNMGMHSNYNQLQQQQQLLQQQQMMSGRQLQQQQDLGDSDGDGSDGGIGPNGEKKKKVKGKGGSSCHQCKSRRNFTALTYCTSYDNLDKKNKKCRKKFCGHCLKKFYKETPGGIVDKTNWRCPSCRKICCCAACRRRKQKDMGVILPVNGQTKPSSSKPKKSKANGQNASMKMQMQRGNNYQGDPMGMGRGKMMKGQGIRKGNDMGGHIVPVSPNTNLLNLQPGEVLNVPPVPTIMMLTSEISSPMTTPLQMPAQCDFIPGQLDLQSDYSDLMGGGSRPSSAGPKSHLTNPYESYSSTLINHSSLPSPLNHPQQRGFFTGSSHMAVHGYYTKNPMILQEQVQRYAREAKASGGTTVFGRMYAIAKSPQAASKINAILARTDLNQAQKVESTAALLRAAINNPFNLTSSN